MDVDHIANLARIELTNKEKEQFEKELSSILDFINQLETVDTSNIHPMTGGTLEENKVRDDALNPLLEEKAAALISQAPEKQGQWIKVKAIFK